jgi:chromosomal replication initiation ATPase DnaA
VRTVPTRDRRSSLSKPARQDPTAGQKRKSTKASQGDKPTTAQRLTRITELGLLQVVEATCAQHYCTVDEFLSDERVPHIMAARRDVALHLREAEWSLPSIAKLLNRDHVSVMRWFATRLQRPKNRRRK